MTSLGKIPNQHQFDLIVIGGGISGACMVREAALRGLKAILLEAGDFGHATSANSLRILHGGIRYLSSFQIQACRQSRAEQAWFAQQFPRYTRRARCIYPIVDQLREGIPIRALKGAYRLATWGLPKLRSEPGDFRSKDGIYRRTYRDLSGVDARSFVAWEEVLMRSPARILIEMLKQATLLGNSCLNYTRVDGLDSRNGRIQGVFATDVERQTEYHFEAPFVVNCGAPQLPGCERAGKQSGSLPQSLAVNLVLRRPALEDVIWVGRGRQAGDNTILLTPRNGQLVVGTFHFAIPRSSTFEQPSAEQLLECIRQLNRTFPRAHFERDDIVGVESGALPVRRDGERIPRLPDQIQTQMSHDNRNGLITVRNLKYTTAHQLARHTIHQIAPGATQRRTPGPFEAENFDWANYHPNRVIPRQRLAETLKMICRQEAVRSLSDLVLRRTEWGREACFRREDLAEVAELVGLRVGHESFATGGPATPSLPGKAPVPAAGETSIQT